MRAGTAASSVRRHSSPVSTTPWQCLMLFFCFSFCIMCCTLFWLFNGYYVSDIVRISLPFSVCVAKDREVIRECMETWMCHLAQRPQRQLSDAFVQSPAASRNFFFPPEKDLMMFTSVVQGYWDLYFSHLMWDTCSLCVCVCTVSLGSTFWLPEQVCHFHIWLISCCLHLSSVKPSILCTVI